MKPLVQSRESLFQSRMQQYEWSKPGQRPQAGCDFWLPQNNLWHGMGFQVDTLDTSSMFIVRPCTASRTHTSEFRSPEIRSDCFVPLGSSKCVLLHLNLNSRMPQVWSRQFGTRKCQGTGPSTRYCKSFFSPASWRARGEHRWLRNLS